MYGLGESQAVGDNVRSSDRGSDQLALLEVDVSTATCLDQRDGWQRHDHLGGDESPRSYSEGLADRANHLGARSTITSSTHCA